jgi:prophage tail gpP-like protein
MNKFEIRLNGSKYDLWESANYSKSLDQMVGTFSFLTSQRPDFPVKRGDRVEILVNNIIQMTGFVFNRSISGDMGGVKVNISGYEKTKDVLDSSLPDIAKQNEGEITLKAICESVVKGIGLDIKIIDDTGGINPFKTTDSQAGASCSNAFDYLESFARKRQVYLTTSSSGNLVLFRPDKSFTAVSPLIHQSNNNNNNIQSFTLNDSEEQRFNTVICRSADNGGFDFNSDFSDKSTDRNGTAIDSQIRSSRYLEIRAEESMKDNECGDRAKEEVNNRRLKGLSYSCSISSQQQSDGSLYQLGQRVKIIDDFAGVKGWFLLKSITNQSATKNPASQSSIGLTLTLPDGYTPQDVLTSSVARKASIED